MMVGAPWAQRPLVQHAVRVGGRRGALGPRSPPVDASTGISGILAAVSSALEPWIPKARRYATGRSPARREVDGAWARLGCELDDPLKAPPTADPKPPAPEASPLIPERLSFVSLGQSCCFGERMKEKTGTCVLCGASGEITGEHVPPKSLFLKPRPSNFITVPMCAACNHSYHLDDEHFRVFLAAGARPGTPLARLWREKVARGLQRRGGLRGRFQKQYESLRVHAETKPLEFYDGNHVSEELLGLLQPFEASRVNDVLEKIIRSLHYHHFGERLMAPVRIDIAPVDNSVWQLTHSDRTGQVGQKGEFVYRFEGKEDSSHVWTLIFYAQRLFTAYVDKAV